MNVKNKYEDKKEKDKKIHEECFDTLFALIIYGFMKTKGDEL